MVTKERTVTNTRHQDVFKNYQRQGPYLVTPKQTVAEVAGLLTRAK